jgi:ABC-type transporter Mla subunit MlaD
VRVTLRVGVAHQDRIKSDSVATIKFTGLMGQNFVAIQPGLDSVVMDPGSLLKSQEMADLNTMLTTMNNVARGIEAVTDSFKGVKIDSIVGPMAKFLQANTNRMYSIVGNMETISRQLAEGKGVAGQLLNDEQLYNSLNTTVVNMEKISKLVANGEGTIGKLMTDDALYQQLNTIAEDFGQLSSDLKTVSAKIANGEGTIGKLVQDDKLYTLLNKTADDFSVVAADLKTVTAKVAKGEGTMGKLLHEDELYNSLNTTAKSLENSSAKLDKLVTNTDALVVEARSTVDAVSDAANSAKSVLAKVDKGEGTLGKLVNQDLLYAESTEAMKNLREIMQKINRGDGSLGMLVNDDSLFKSARATLQKVDNATETMEDQGPISIIGVMFNGLF